jgi:hypothetical protein
LGNLGKFQQMGRTARLAVFHNVLLTPTPITQGAGTNFYIALEADPAVSFQSILLQAVSGDFRSIGQFSFSGVVSPSGVGVNPLSPVPVPGAAILMGTALAGLGGFGVWRRRRRQTSAAG